MSTFNILLNPIINAQMVKAIASFSVVVICRRKTNLLHLLLQNRHDLCKFFVQFFWTIIAIRKVNDTLPSAISIAQVHCLEIKTLTKMQYCRMVAINKLATQFTDSTISPGGRIRVHTPANMVRRFIYIAWKTGVLQR